MTNIALHVIKKCGGPPATAKLAGRDVSTVYRWTYPKERGGYGGSIPDEDKRTLLLNAPGAGIDLTWDDFNPLIERDGAQEDAA